MIGVSVTQFLIVLFIDVIVEIVTWNFFMFLQVREFSVTDVQPYSIQLVWQDESGQEADMEVFPKNHQVNYLF